MNDKTARIFQGVRADTGPDLPSLGRPLRDVPSVPLPTKPAVNLAGTPKVVLVVGPGGSGKTIMLRLIAEWTLERDPDSEAIFAAVGDRRDLAHYFSVSQPSSYDPAQETHWLEALFAHCMEHKVSAAIDFDGGDTTVTGLVTQQHDLVAMLEAAGISVVVIYMLTPRVTDLTTLATLEGAGFQPPATAVVLNEGTSDASVPFDVAFEPIQRHSDFRAIVERGAVVIRMPRLHAASAVEQRRVLFGQARDNAVGLNAFDRGRVARWLLEMGEAMDILVKAGWLP